MVVPHLFLAGCIKAMKAALFSSCPLVSLAFNRCIKRDLDKFRLYLDVFLKFLFNDIIFVKI